MVDIKVKSYQASLLTFLAGIVLSPILLAQESYSPYVNREYPKNVYWGDTHLHTNLSFDAYNFGTKKLGPDDAYRFAKGETMTASNGMKVRISRPLDFLVVADHAADMGVMTGLEAQDPALLASTVGRRWGPMVKKINETATADPEKAFSLSMKLFAEWMFEATPAEDTYRHSVWKNAASVADTHNAPGKFTTLIGFEWTSMFFLASSRGYF